MNKSTLKAHNGIKISPSLDESCVSSILFQYDVAGEPVNIDVIVKEDRVLISEIKMKYRYYMFTDSAIMAIFDRSVFKRQTPVLEIYEYTLPRAALPMILRILASLDDDDLWDLVTPCMYTNCGHVTVIHDPKEY